MDKEQQAQHKRHETVLGVLDKYQSLWTGNAPFAAARLQLANGIQHTIMLQGTQGTVITGVTEDKVTARRNAALAALIVAGALASWADKTGNHELFAKVDYTLYDLTHGKEEDDETTMANILQLGTDNLAAMGPNGGLTQADLDDLDAKLEIWETSITKPRQAKSGTKGATNQIPTALLANDRTIDRQLDRLIERYRLSNPDFFQEYQVAKVKVDPGYRKSSPTPPSPTPPTP